MKSAVVYLCCYFIITNCCAQEFSSPVRHEIKLAGTFGELRTNHFHMGVDIKSSRGKHPDAILAADVGFISRIKISRSGYGNALYIEHPSGYTTVYAHLSSYSEYIDTFVNKVQVDSQTFEIDFYPDSLDLPVSRGQEIGKMGNSGSSHGPHLHFEIRKTKSEIPINPMKFGIKTLDKTPPVIKQVNFIHLDDKKQPLYTESRNPTIGSNGNYKLPPVKLGAWRTGIAIQAYDPMNNNYNKNGIYKLEMFVNGKKSYAIAFDSISYNDTRYINAHIDYAYYKEYKTRLHRCFKLPANELPNVFDENAVIKLYEDTPIDVSIKVYDYDQNVSEVKFSLQRSTVLDPTPKIFNYHLSHKQANVVEHNKLKVYFPENALYEDLYLYLSSAESEFLSEVYQIGNDKVPLHKAVKLFIDGSHIPQSLRNKVCLLECSKSDQIITYGGEWQDNYFVSEVLSLGNFTLGIDTIAPKIEGLEKGTDFTQRSFMSFKIQDNYSNSGKAKGLDYQASIDGKWAKFSYDLKTKRIRHKFDIPVSNTTHTLLLSIVDDRGNVRKIERKFIR